MYTLHTEKYERITSEDNWFRITSDVEEEIEEKASDYHCRTPYFIKQEGN